MNRSASVIVLLLFMCVPAMSAFSLSGSSGLPEFIREGVFAQYTQTFSLGEIYGLYWQVHSVNRSGVELLTRSHGLYYNSTGGEFQIVRGGGTMFIDGETWVIIQMSDSNGSAMSGPPVGEMSAFWISTEVNESSVIHNTYDQFVHPTSGVLELDCLMQPRECWITDNIYRNGTDMKRWYDKSTGIVLRIETSITKDSEQVSILEVLNATNIAELFPVGIGLNSMLLAGIAGGSFCVVLGLVVLYQRRRIRSSTLAEYGLQHNIASKDSGCLEIHYLD